MRILELSTGKLSKSIGGRLQFGSLPPLGGVHEPVRRIVADVERVRENDVFWALPGREQLAEQAYLRGALGVVACRRHVEPWAGKFSIAVKDSRAALDCFARCSRRQFAGQLIAVAGSLGKSTTKHAIDSLLSRSFVGAPTDEGQFDDIESLLNLAHLPPDDDFSTLEVSSQRLVDAAQFLTFANPDIAVLTSDCVFQSPHELVHPDDTGASVLVTALSGTKSVIVNGDDQRLRRMVRGLDRGVIFTGRAGDDDFKVTDVRYCAGELSFVVENTRIVARVAGRHRLTSLMLAYAVARLMGMSPVEIAESMHELTALPTRSQVTEANGITIIDDTYHATPEALAASFELLNESFTKRRRIFVCGDIAVDVTRPRHVHRLLANAAVTRYRCDGLVTCGTYAHEMQSAARMAGLPASAALAFNDVDDAVTAWRSWADAGDVVLVAGHRMSGMQTIVAALQQSASTKEDEETIRRVA